MDAVWFDRELAGALGDSAGRYYSQEMRLTAIRRAVHAYSQHRPLRKRFGTGFVWLAAQSAENSLSVIGGTFTSGDRLLLEPGLPNGETVMVQGVAIAPPTPATMASTLLLTLTVPLTKAHSAGAYLTREKPGLNLIAGADTYALPIDWIRPEMNSLETALGAKTSVQRHTPGNDVTVSLVQRYSSIGLGRTLNYGANPNGSSMPGDAPTFTFRTGAISMLTLTPAPTKSQTLDFDYFGQHVLETISDEAFEAVLAYARCACFEGRAAWLGAQNDYTEGDVKEEFSKSVAQLLALAKGARQEFDTKVRLVSYASSG